MLEAVRDNKAPITGRGRGFCVRSSLVGQLPPMGIEYPAIIHLVTKVLDGVTFKDGIEVREENNQTEKVAA
jgi:hypothetical protein